MNNKRPVVIFDFDGTLINSFDPGLDYLFSELLPEYKITTVSRQQISELRSQSIFGVVKSIPGGWYKIPQIIPRLTNWVKSATDEMKPYPQIPELIKSLKKENYDLMILTSNKVENVKIILEKNSLLKYFTAIDESEGLFNKTKALKKMLKQHNLVNTEVVYIGDEIRDVKACQKAKVRIIAVTYGFNSAVGLRKERPDYIVNEPRDILSIVRGLTAQSKS